MGLLDLPSTVSFNLLLAVALLQVRTVTCSLLILKPGGDFSGIDVRDFGQ